MVVVRSNDRAATEEPRVRRIIGEQEDLQVKMNETEWFLCGENSEIVLAGSHTYTRASR